MYNPVPPDCLVPTIYSARLGEMPGKLGMRMTRVPHKVAVRITGGCGKLPPEIAQAIYRLFVEAFAGFAGVLLFGGTRMLWIRTNQDGVRLVSPYDVRPGITEVAPMIRLQNPGCQMLGVVPVEEPPLRSEFNVGTVLGETNEFVTIIHPGQDFCVMIQASQDTGVVWDEEYKYCLRVLRLFEQEAGFTHTLTISCQGGGTTEREILATAQQGRNLLLVDGFGGETGIYARKRAFRRTHRNNVRACDPEVSSMRDALFEFGVLEAQSSNVIPITSGRSKGA